MTERIHPTAIVDSKAELASDVRVGPYAVIGAFAVLGAGTQIGAHAVIDGPVTMGRENTVFPFAAIGGIAQTRKAIAKDDGPRAIEIGDRNVFREHVTIHRASHETPTRIGSRNLLMVGCHVAHDVAIGSDITIANGVQIAGHAVIEDFATLAGLAGIAQFVRVGESAFVAAGAMVEANVPPFVIVQGDRARVRALNRVGLERREIPLASLAALERAFRTIFRSKDPRAVALRSIATDDPYVKKLVDALMGAAVL